MERLHYKRTASLVNEAKAEMERRHSIEVVLLRHSLDEAKAEMERKVEESAGWLRERDGERGEHAKQLQAAANDATQLLCHLAREQLVRAAAKDDEARARERQGQVERERERERERQEQRAQAEARCREEERGHQQQLAEQRQAHEQEVQAVKVREQVVFF